jgi:hypothetical protein
MRSRGWWWDRFRHRASENGLIRSCPAEFEHHGASARFTQVSDTVASYARVLVGIAFGIPASESGWNVLIASQIADPTFGNVLADGTHEIRWRCIGPENLLGNRDECPMTGNARSTLRVPSPELRSCAISPDG